MSVTQGCCTGHSRQSAIPDVACTLQSLLAAQGQKPGRIVSVPGGRTRLGDDNGLFPQDGERPSRFTKVRPFDMDPYAVTNDWFAQFVAATAYVTDAERYGWSLVFHLFLPGAPAPDPSCALDWWRKTEGATWRTPEGPRSTLGNRGRHPVVHVSWNDAVAFCRWTGGRLPTEAEWECGARGGLDNARFPWGDREPDDATFQPCNIWQGSFPLTNAALDGFVGTAPVDSFAPNAFGLYNMVGNTWEWCADAFRLPSLSRQARLRNDRARAGDERLLKGGSYLCHRSYCYRYRIAARVGAGDNSSTGHVGFRVVFDRKA